MSKNGKTNISGGGGIMSDDVTLKQSELLTGYTTITADSNDEVVEGMLPDSSTSITLSGVTDSKIIPYGYHNGNHTASMNVARANGGTITPTTYNQTFNGNVYRNSNYVIAGSGNLVSQNIRYGVSIFGVGGGLVDYSELVRGGHSLFNYNTFPSILSSGWGHVENFNAFVYYGTNALWNAYVDYASDDGITAYPNTVYPLAILKKSVDLTPYRTLEVAYTGHRTARERVGVMSAFSPHSNNFTHFTNLGECSVENLLGLNKSTFDISGYSGQHFIAIGGVGNNRKLWGLLDITLWT